MTKQKRSTAEQADVEETGSGKVSVRVVGAESGRRWTSEGRGRLIPALLAVITLGLVAAGVVLTLERREVRDLQQRRDAAERLAEQQALSLLGISGDNVADRIEELLTHSTGDFRKQLQGIRNSFGEIVREGEVSSTGEVDLAGVVSSTQDKSRIILALSSTVTNSQTKEPEPRNYRISVDLTWVEDEWLVSGMEFAP